MIRSKIKHMFDLKAEIDEYMDELVYKAFDIYADCNKRMSIARYNRVMYGTDYTSEDILDWSFVNHEQVEIRYGYDMDSDNITLTLDFILNQNGEQEKYLREENDRIAVVAKETKAKKLTSTFMSEIERLQAELNTLKGYK